MTSALLAFSPSVAFTVKFLFLLGSADTSTSGLALSLVPHQGSVPLPGTGSRPEDGRTCALDLPLH